MKLNPEFEPEIYPGGSNLSLTNSDELRRLMADQTGRRGARRDDGDRSPHRLSLVTRL